MEDKILNFRADADTEQTINAIYELLKADPSKYGFRSSKKITRKALYRFMAVTTISVMNFDIEKLFKIIREARLWK